jgi:hypothetical protein
MARGRTLSLVVERLTVLSFCMLVGCWFGPSGTWCELGSGTGSVSSRNGEAAPVAVGNTLID